MRNLKKMLSLVMALAMVASFMVVGASAAEFTDAKDIKNADAVNTLVSLGVIKGYDTGDFKPDGIVTRAEMAKMICVAINGGNDPKLGNTVSTFTDVPATHWASGYIDYCANMGIIAGYADKSFKPNATVTGTEAAKMLLIMIGYDAGNSNLVGAQWDINTNVQANARGFYQDISVDLTAGLTRNNAAQMIYNAVQATMVEYDYKLTTVNGQLTTLPVVIDTKAGAAKDTILKAKFNLTSTEGILVATGEYDLSATIGSNAGLAAEDGFVVYADSVNGVKQAAADTYFEHKTQDHTNLMGQRVNVLSGKDGKVYGIYAVNDKNTVVATTLSKVEITDASSASADGKVKIDGTSYKFSNTNDVLNGENAGTYANINAIPSKKAMADEVKFIDNTGDGKFDLALITPILGVNKVTYVSSTTFTAGASYSFDKVTAPEGLVKDDYVIRTSNYYADKNVFVKAETVSGEVAGTKGSSPVTDVSVGGNWYKSVTDATGTSTISGDALALTSEFDLIVVNGIIYRSDLVSAASKDLLVVTAVAGAVNAGGNTEATVLFTDGTIKTVVLKGAMVSSTVDKLYTYKIKNNVYELTAVANSAGQKAGYDNAEVASTNGFVKSTKTINGKNIASDAVILVKYDKDSSTSTNYAYKVMTGAELNKLSNNFNSDVTTTYLFNDGGFADIKVAFMAVDGTQSGHAMMSGITSSTAVGYVTSASYTESADDTTYTTFKVWNGSETVTLKDENQGTYAVGDVLTYDADTKGFITVVDSNTAPVAITALDLDQKRIAINGTAYDLDDDYVILYVDSADGSGVNSGSIDKALSPATGVWTNNAKVIIANGDVKYIIVDTVKNEWDGAGVTVTGTVSATYAASEWTVATTVVTDKITVAASGKLTTVNAATDGGAVNAIAGEVGAELTLGTAITSGITTSNFYTGTAGSASADTTPDTTKFTWTADCDGAGNDGWLHA